MRILHITHQYPPDYIGGVELYTQTVARAQAVLGHNVAVFTHDADGQNSLHWRDGDVAIHAVQLAPVSPSRRFLAIFAHGAATAAFSQLLDQFQPDLVHIQHMMGLPAALITQLTARRIPFVVTLHDFWWGCANAQLLTNDTAQICDGPDALWFNCTRCAAARAGAPRPGLAAGLAMPLVSPLMARRAYLLRHVLQKAAHLIAPTNFVANWHRDHDLAAERLTVLPLGVERPAEIPAREVAAHEPLRFTYIGSLAWQKGLHVLLQAFKQVQGQASLWIAGNPETDAAYAQSLQQLADTRVRFWGQLDRQQVWRTLAQTDMVVAPSLCYESFSLLVHEAFAAGIPVLASRQGALAEVVQDGVNGMLAAPGNVAAWRAALQSIVDQPGQLAQLRTGIQEPLTVDEHVARLMGIYGEVVSGGVEE
ncbi:MAG: glycosyltransferase family 4 protein [Caldilineaceae bacterium]